MTLRFRALLAALPEQVQRQAQDAYRLFTVNPWHPSLRFRRIGEEAATHSVRVEAHCRVLGFCEGDPIVRDWISTHAANGRQFLRR
jgi:hypothetical protein